MKNTVPFKEIEAIVRQAGDILLQAKLTDGNIHKKEGIANFVTTFDVEIQRVLIEKLRELLPGAGFFGEEDTDGSMHESLSEGYTFFIDPIDGTTNFMFSYHHSCISVGLAKNREMIAGFVYNPYVDEMYAGIRGVGSYLNGRRLKMANWSISQGIVAFGCARYNESDTEVLFDVVKKLFLKSLSIRNGGSAALDLCRTASGNNAAYLELKLQPYDYAAASVIIEEAGGWIGQVNGSPVTLDQSCSVVAGTMAAVDEVRKIINDSLLAVTSE